jgi:hypothetical protein
MDPIKLQKALKGVTYPADKDTLVDTARRNGADAGIVDELQAIDGGRYESPAKVSAAVRQAER